MSKTLAILLFVSSVLVLQGNTANAANTKDIFSKVSGVVKFKSTKVTKIQVEGDIIQATSTVNLRGKNNDKWRFRLPIPWGINFYPLDINSIDEMVSKVTSVHILYNQEGKFIDAGSRSTKKGLVAATRTQSVGTVKGRFKLSRKLKVIYNLTLSK